MIVRLSDYIKDPARAIQMQLRALDEKDRERVQREERLRADLAFYKRHDKPEPPHSA